MPPAKKKKDKVKKEVLAKAKKGPKKPDKAKAAKAKFGPGISKLPFKPQPPLPAPAAQPQKPALEEQLFAAIKPPDITDADFQAVEAGMRADHAFSDRLPDHITSPAFHASLARDANQRLQALWDSKHGRYTARLALANQIVSGRDPSKALSQVGGHIADAIVTDLQSRRNLNAARSGVANAAFDARMTPSPTTSEAAADHPIPRPPQPQLQRPRYMDDTTMRERPQHPDDAPMPQAPRIPTPQNPPPLVRPTPQRPSPPLHDTPMPQAGTPTTAADTVINVPIHVSVGTPSTPGAVVASPVAAATPTPAPTTAPAPAAPSPVGETAAPAPDPAPAGGEVPAEDAAVTNPPQSDFTFEAPTSTRFDTPLETRKRKAVTQDVVLEQPRRSELRRAREGIVSRTSKRLRQSE